MKGRILDTSRRAFLATAPSLAVAAPAAVAQGENGQALSLACAFPPDWPVLGNSHKILAARLKGLGQSASTVDAARAAGAAEAGWPRRGVAAYRALQNGEVDILVTTPGMARAAGEPGAASLLAGPPFALSADELDGWYRDGDGAGLADTAYREAGLRALYLATASPGTGLWFRGAPPQRSLDGWPVVAPEPAAAILAQAGAQARPPDAGGLADALAAMEEGAVAGMTPAIDRAVGLADLADGFLPGAWYQPGLVVLVLVREALWESLDAAAATALTQAVIAQGADTTGRLMAENGAAHQDLDLESSTAAAAGEQLQADSASAAKLVVSWPQPILNDLGERAGVYLAARAQENSLEGRIFDSQLAMRPGALGFTRYHQQSLYRARLLPFPFAR